ncbi:HAD-IG family 5'-nucleotidase, partial [bacterium]|nr:HAD-IG family 5'-nucleotidase [bacterium]
MKLELYINRTLNLKRIKVVGLDMDHTIVRYKVEAFEHYTYLQMIKKLVEHKSYPAELKSLTFDYKKSIQGLVIDRKNGNILKLNRYGKVKMAYHGSQQIDFLKLKNLYSGRVIDLADFNVQSLDTNFSISNGILFGQLVELKDQGHKLPSYETISHDLKEVLDLCHKDGSIKSEIIANKEKYLYQDKGVVELMQKLKLFGKKVIVITNSEIHYTNELLNYTINPFLKDGQTWIDLFDITITYSKKPSFFNDEKDFYKIDMNDFSKSKYDGKVCSGIFEGGSAHKLQEDLGFFGEDFLYFGDHIYGDVVALKKTFNWRTALVLHPLEDELLSIEKS